MADTTEDGKVLTQQKQATEAGTTCVNELNMNPNIKGDKEVADTTEDSRVLTQLRLQCHVSVMNTKLNMNPNITNKGVTM